MGNVMLELKKYTETLKTGLYAQVKQQAALEHSGNPPAHNVHSEATMFPVIIATGIFDCTISMPHLSVLRQPMLMQNQPLNGIA
jgi:hypothetical protein